jgi:hypothetical protein
VEIFSYSKEDSKMNLSLCSQKWAVHSSFIPETISLIDPFVKIIASPILQNMTHTSRSYEVRMIYLFSVHH